MNTVLVETRAEPAVGRGEEQVGKKNFSSPGRTYLESKISTLRSSISTLERVGTGESNRGAGILRNQLEKLTTAWGSLPREAPDQKKKSVIIGSLVTISDGGKAQYVISPEEGSEPQLGLLSRVTVLGSALLGCEEGEYIMLGKEKITILKIE